MTRTKRGLNGAQRDPRAADRQPLRQMPQAGTDATPKVDNVERLPRRRQPFEGIGNPILDVVEGGTTVANARSPHRAMNGAQAASFTETDEGRRVAVVIAAHLRAVETGHELFLQDLVKRTTLIVLLIVTAAAPVWARDLEIFFIDVEGGQSTLILTPAGESLLIDAGYGGRGGRDPARILEVSRHAGIERIDYLLVTHFHPDHVGGVPELAAQIPIGTFIDLGDLSGNTLRRLVCPRNLIGSASVYLVAHHGEYDTNLPAVYQALRPRVAVMNNGVTKGGDPASFKTLHAQPVLEDLWQLHESHNPGARNSPPDLIANIDDGEGSSAHWIRLVASDDGSFRIVNGRTGFEKSYAQRPRE